MTKNYAYEILKLPYGADPDQIKKSYASLILQYKPDEYPLEFMQIHEAYKFLTSCSSAGIDFALKYASFASMTSSVKSQSTSLVS